MSDEPNTSKELFYAAGDKPDPSGIDPRARGLEVGHDFTKGALGHPFLLYQMGNEEIFLEADVYAYPGEPMHIILHCPCCLARGLRDDQAGMTIKQDAKPFSYAPQAVAPPFPGWSHAQMAETFSRGTGGVLTIGAPIQCARECDPQLARGVSVASGLPCCGWKVAIENNVVRDTR